MFDLFTGNTPQLQQGGWGARKSSPINTKANDHLHQSAACHHSHPTPVTTKENEGAAAPSPLSPSLSPQQPRRASAAPWDSPGPALGRAAPGRAAQRAAAAPGPSPPPSSSSSSLRFPSRLGWERRSCAAPHMTAARPARPFPARPCREGAAAAPGRRQAGPREGPSPPVPQRWAPGPLPRLCRALGTPPLLPTTALLFSFW